VDGTIAPGDRITYAEAIDIRGLSHTHLARLAAAGALTRVGGTAHHPYSTWLSRSESEALALTRYHRGHATDYWLTMAEAAELLGAARQHVYKVRRTGRYRSTERVTGTGS
jgi:hypothetical protein